MMKHISGPGNIDHCHAVMDQEPDSPASITHFSPWSFQNVVRSSDPPLARQSRGTVRRRKLCCLDTQIISVLVSMDSMIASGPVLKL
ncbi:hypothetical protein [Arthrobacter bambusae]|uniref:Uncharacterized protein n=1 Tax=Arthrobacter bambusae TaxID=1338426 RepID=A0AAW8D9U5_9MICC|nr:hypothetical protein [Arthrobacter bambusae]MDP9904505.1 hypothetical protein [Arthrobacter bambusae]MDQ0178842.1 hypothetical protein [Arthrobacter bambusae]